jgi:xylan 1,4-beta-xylosidase
MSDLIINFNNKTGLIKGIHGVNNGPVTYGSLVDVSEYYKRIQIPYVRLHDTNWPHPREVDIPSIFSDFDAAPDDPASYDFRRTDEYIQSILNTGAKIIYRLGVSIEHTSTKYFTHPPKDYEKWAKICIGIIKHYNHGWANGFYYNIEYWEIWNEPDGGITMWSGTPEEFFKLYGVASKAIKQFDTTVKVGGCAICRYDEYDYEGFLEGFLEYCQKHKLPLDFFTWHNYEKNPEKLLKFAPQMRNLLNHYGYDKAESHLNEWNYMYSEPNLKKFEGIFRSGNEYYTQKVFDKLRNEEGASFDAAALILLQDSPIDIANFYDGAPSSFWSLFNYYGVPQKNYYAFEAFYHLYLHSQRVEVVMQPNINGLYCCAGMDETKEQGAILLSNFNAESRVYEIDFTNLPGQNQYICEQYVIDASNDLTLTASRVISKENKKIGIYIEKYSVVLLKIIC